MTFLVSTAVIPTYKWSFSELRLGLSSEYPSCDALHLPAQPSMLRLSLRTLQAEHTRSPTPDHDLSLTQAIARLMSKLRQFSTSVQAVLEEVRKPPSEVLALLTPLCTKLEQLDEATLIEAVSVPLPSYIIHCLGGNTKPAVWKLHTN